MNRPPERQLVYECPEPECGLRCYNEAHAAAHGDCTGIEPQERSHALTTSRCIDAEGRPFNPDIKHADRSRRSIEERRAARAKEMALGGPFNVMCHSCRFLYASPDGCPDCGRRFG